jgi:hypothetical protein
MQSLSEITDLHIRFMSQGLVRWNEPAMADQPDWVSWQNIADRSNFFDCSRFTE